MRRSSYFAAAVLALATARPAPGFAQALALASLGKQILQNVVFGSVKNDLIGSLAGMGCKGSALAGLIATAGSTRGRLPTGMARGPAGMGVAPGGMDPAMMSQAMAMAQQQSGRPGMPPDQAAAMQKSLASLQDAMAAPLSREETMAVFDELAGLGVLTETLRNEARECIALAPPGAGDSLGVAGALMKNTMLPSLRQAKERMANLSADEQKQLADGMVDSLKSARPGDRKAFLDGLGAGFFPPAVVGQVRAKIAAQ